MKKDHRFYLRYILESINLIYSYIEEIDEKIFLSSSKHQDMVVRRLEIIGEAVKHLPDSLKQKYDEVAWKEIAGMRDVLAHEYFGVDYELVWEIIKKELPFLEETINKMINE